MGRTRWWQQLRFRVLFGVVVVLLLNTLYAEYAVRRTLSSELPSVELQSLQAMAGQLHSSLQASYAKYGRLDAELLEQPPQIPMRLYDAGGHVVADSSSFDRDAGTDAVRGALGGRASPARIVGEGESRFGVIVLPISDGERVVGAVEVAQLLPPIDRFQERIQAEFATVTAATLVSLLAFCLFLGIRFRQWLEDIRNQTEAIVRGDFERRLEYDRRDELGEVGSCLNRMAEDLDNLAKTRNEFLSKVSHELRTPLTIAKGFTSMLTCGPVLPEQQRTITIIDSQIDDLTRLVNDLLDLTRHDCSSLKLDTASIDCVDLLNEIAEQHRPVLGADGIALVVEQRAASTWVRGDRQRLQQVLGNLIGNASRYCRAKIWLVLDADDESIVLRVRDNGAGIAPEDLRRIFEPFFQARHGPSGRAGLGLTVARELVLAHGGSLEVESQLGAGTTFSVRLPRTPKPAPAPRRPALRLNVRPRRPAAAAAEPQPVAVIATSTSGREVP